MFTENRDDSNPPAEVSEVGQAPYGKGKLQDELFLQDRAVALDILRIAVRFMTTLGATIWPSVFTFPIPGLNFV